VRGPFGLFLHPLAAPQGPHFGGSLPQKRLAAGERELRICKKEKEGKGWIAT
jgi:hypothetical protein